MAETRAASVSSSPSGALSTEASGTAGSSSNVLGIENSHVVGSEFNQFIFNMTRGPANDTFVPSFGIPKNPRAVCLDFSLDAQGNPNPTSMEGRLKAALMRCDAESSQSVAAVGDSQESRLLGATGMGGVGKTCALIGIGHDVDVQRRYTGGVYFISLGKDATAQDVIRQVADIVELSGGVSKASEMRRCEMISVAMRTAALWFAHRRCLFLCDDLWGTDDKRTGFYGDLCKLVERGDGSCLLFSTRDNEIGSNASADPVIFKNREPQSTAAKEILRGHANMKENDLRDMDESGRLDLRYVLDKCAGLPVALAVSGRSIARLLRTPGRAPTSAVSAYKRGLHAARDRLIATGVDLGSAQYPSVRQVVEASLTAADALKPRGGIFSIHDMHSALCVIQKQQWVPLTMLARLWGFKTEDEAEEAATLMSDFSIVDTECRGNDAVLGVKLHDLIHDSCVARADENGGMSLWHRRLIDGYATHLLRATTHAPEDAAAGTRAPWWSDELRDDGYFHANIARHLVGCGEEGRREMIALLLDFRWAKRQFEVSGILTVRSDCDLLQSTTTAATFADADAGDDLSSALVLIAGAVQLSWGYAHANRQELAFQLHGRLFSRRAEFTAVETFVASVERHAERPWLRCIDAFLVRPGGPLIASHQLDFSTRCFACVPGQNLFVLGGYDGAVRVWDMASGAAVGEMLGWHAYEVNSVAVSPDGSRIVSGSADCTVRVWDMASGSAVGEPLRGHGNQVRSVAVSPDGSRIVSGGWDGTVRVWDMESGAAVGEPLRGHDGQVNSVAVSPDGSRIVSGVSDRTVRVWDMASGAAVGEPLRGNDGVVWSVAVSLDGSRIVSGGEDCTVRVWDMASGAAVGGPLRGHDGEVTSVAVSPDGSRIVSIDGDYTLHVWHVASGAAVGEPLRGHDSELRSVAVSPDWSCIVSGGEDGTVRVSDMASGAAVGEPLRGHDGEVWSVAVSPDGSRIVSGGADRTVRVWDMASGAAVGEPLRGHDSEVFSVAVSPDGSRIVSGGADHTVRVWDMASGAAVGEPLRGHDGELRSVAVNPDGSRIVSIDADCTLRVWDMASEAAVGEPLRRNDGEVWPVAVSPDGSRIVSIDGDFTLRVSDIASGAAVGEPLRGHDGEVWPLAVSPDGSCIVSACGDGTVRVWDIASGAAVVKPLRWRDDWVWSVAVSPDGSRIVSGSQDGKVRVWDMASGAAVGETLRGHGGRVTSVAVSPDGSRIVSGGADHTVRVWDMASGAAVGETLRGHGGLVTSVAVSPDGSRVVSGGMDGTVRVWDMASGAAVGEPLGGHDLHIWSVAVSPDGSRIMSGGFDRTVRVWDMASGAAVGEPLRGHGGRVTSVAVSHDGSRIVSGSDDGTVIVWSSATGECIRTIPETGLSILNCGQLLASAGVDPRPSGGAGLRIQKNAVWLVADGSCVARLATLDSSRGRRPWHFDAVRRTLWVGRGTSGLVRIELVE